MASINVSANAAIDDVETLTVSFIRHLRAENLSANTIDSYQESLRQFSTFLISSGMPHAAGRIKREHVEHFIEALLSSKSPATANNRFRGIQQFWKWAVEEGEVEHSPMANMRPPKVPENMVPIIREEDMEKLFRACSGKSFEERRDHALLRVFVSTGARKSEIANLRIHETNPDLNDLDLDSKWGATARIFGKGHKWRLVRLSPKTVRSLDRYLRARTGHRDADSQWLWLGRQGRLSADGCARVLKRRAKQAGLGELHLHQIRHSYAHAFLADGGEETDLMRSMGWESREMVSRYAKSAAQERALMASDRVGFASRL